jgi:hypothetical protein
MGELSVAEDCLPRADRPRWAPRFGRALRRLISNSDDRQQHTEIDSRIYRITLAVAALFTALDAVRVGRYAHEQWQHGALANDFAIFDQAWYQIAHGDFSPYSTVLDVGYIRSHFELIMWIIAPLWWVTRSGEALLLGQAMATVAAQFFVVRWAALRACDSLAASPETSAPWRIARISVLPLAGFVILSANERLMDSVITDFHFQALATLLMVLAATDISRGRRRGFLWILAAMTCGDVAGSYIVGLGVSALLVRGRRQWGVALIGIGLGWMLALTAGGFTTGTPRGEFAYLAGYSDYRNVSFLAIGLGVLLHPTRPWRMVQHRGRGSASTSHRPGAGSAFCTRGRSASA